MSTSDNVKRPYGREFWSADLDVQECAVEEHISFLITEGTVGTAFKKATSWPNPTTLAAVDEAIELLRCFRVQTQILKDGGYPDTDARLTAILGDCTAARATLAKTIGILNAADRADIMAFARARTAWEATQKAWINERNAKAKEQANGNRNVL